MTGQVEHLAAEAPLVIVPSHELDEVIVECKTGLCIKDAGVRIGDEVGGNDLFINILDNTLHGAFACSLDNCADLLVACALLEAAGQVNDGNISTGNTHGGSGQLALELRDNLADCFCSAGAGGDDIAVNTAAKTPILLGEAVNNFLSCSIGMDGGHEAFDYAEVVVEDLCKRCKAVGGAGCVGNDLYVGSVLIKVYTADEHRSIVLGGAGENDYLSACIKVSLCLLGGEECAGALENILNAHCAPGKLCGIAVADYCNALAVYGDGIIVVLNGSLETAVYGVVLNGVCQLCRALIGSIDGNDLDIVSDDAGSECQTANAAKTIDSNFNHIVYSSIKKFQIIRGKHCLLFGFNCSIYYVQKSMFRYAQIFVKKAAFSSLLLYKLLVFDKIVMNFVVRCANMSDLSLFPAAFSMLDTAVVISRRGKIVYMNPSAIILAGSDITGKPDDLLLPAHIVSNQADSFITTALFNRVSCTVRVTSVNGFRVHMLVFDQTQTGSADTVLSTLRSSMSNIKFSASCIEGIAEEASDERLMEYVHTLNRNYYRIKRTLDNLSTLSGIASGTLPFCPEPLDMTELCRDITDTVDLLTKKQEVRINFYAPEHTHIIADRILMRQLLLNLLSNSILSCGRGGHISISLLQTDRNLIIGVDDDGSGIPIDELATVFSRYKQDTPILKPSGSGIGLAVVRSIAELHKGTIIVESRGGGTGTSVRVMLSYDIPAGTGFASEVGEYGDSDIQCILTQLSTCLTLNCYGDVLE